MRILGLDVSHHQKPNVVPWQLLYDEGFRFVIVRLAFGLSEDKRAPYHIERARDVGFDVMGYAWLDPLYSASAQADLHARLAEKYSLPKLWEDVEQWWGSWTAYFQARRGERAWSTVPRLMASRIDSHARAALSRLTDPGMYSAKWFINGYARSIGYWMGNHPLWLANYTIKNRTAKTWAEFHSNVPAEGRLPALPQGVLGDYVYIWQWTSSYRPPGVSINLDLNVWLESEREYKKMVGKEEPAPSEPPAPPTDDTNLRIIIPKDAALQLRAAIDEAL